MEFEVKLGVKTMCCAMRNEVLCSIVLESNVLVLTEMTCLVVSWLFIFKVLKSMSPYLHSS